MLLFLSLMMEYSIAQISVTTPADTVGKYNPYEITILHPIKYDNDWDDVQVFATFNGSSSITVNGFFYDDHIWKVRFAAPDTGVWNYLITFVTPSKKYSYSSSVKVLNSRTEGFLKQDPNNSHRLIFPSGKLFNGIGLEDCLYDFTGDGNPLNDFGFDGGSTGAKFTTLDNYMNAYGSSGAGFNLFRFTSDNCSFKLYNSITIKGNTYDVTAGIRGDSVVKSVRKNGLRLFMDFFGPPVFNQINGSTPLEDAAIKRYINYIVARYGAYVDIWELFNENHASDYFIGLTTLYIRALDPYKRLISISDPQPSNSAIDIIAPHWYEKESELLSDTRVVEMIGLYKKYNKPIIYGEQGNSVQNWDPLSAERMRIRSWTAFFQEGMFIFWNTSYAMDYKSVSANIYLGPQERGYIRALQNYTALADSGVISTNFLLSNSGQIRGYGLVSPKLILGYFHHYASHNNSSFTTFTVRLHKPGVLYWINPADGVTLDSVKIGFGTQTLTTPQFNIDLAMLVKLDTSPNAFNSAEKLDVAVFPNPAITGFFVDGNFNGTALIELYSIAGKKVFSKKDVINDKVININLSPGVYPYFITADGRVSKGKLIIK